MLKIYDVKCEKCGYEYEQWVENEEFEKCEKCGGEVSKIFATKMNFKLVYNNQTQMCGWAKTGYDSNTYWDDVKKERSKGKDVEPYI